MSLSEIDSLIDSIDNLKINKNDNTPSIELINGYQYYTFDKDGVSYYYDYNRTKWIPFRSIEKNKFFFIDENILTLEQISDLSYYRNILLKLLTFEEWQISGEYPGYQFSSLGRIKLKNGEISDRKQNSNGYIKSQLVDKDGETKSVAIHRIISMIFIQNNDPSKIEVNHINGIKHDNRVVNLEWVTPSENVNSRVFINTTNSTKRTVYQYDTNGNFVKEWESMTAIVNYLGVKGIDYAVDTGRIYKGYLWYFKKDEIMYGEIFINLYLEEINSIIPVSNKGRYMRDNGTISYGTLLNSGYMVCNMKNKQITVHRMVMMAFHPIQNHKEMVVDHIDSNKDNNCVENLRWCTPAQNTQYYYANNVHKSNKTTTMRPVIITHSNTGMEYEFISLTAAGKESGFSYDQLKDFLRGRNKKGYLLDLRGYFTVRYKDEHNKVIRNSENLFRAKVNQFDLNGNFIRQYNSLTEAANSLHTDGVSNIGSCCRGNISTFHGYIWRYDDQSILERTNKCEVVQFSLDCKYLALFESVRDAGDTTGTECSSISEVCKGKQKSAGGYFWMYKKDYLSYCAKIDGDFV
jgi:hypothetical protein